MYKKIGRFNNEKIEGSILVEILSQDVSFSKVFHAKCLLMCINKSQILHKNIQKPTRKYFEALRVNRKRERLNRTPLFPLKIHQPYFASHFIFTRRPCASMKISCSFCRSFREFHGNLIGIFVPPFLALSTNFDAANKSLWWQQRKTHYVAVG